MAKARAGKNCWEHSTAFMECVKEEHWGGRAYVVVKHRLLNTMGPDL